METHQSNMVLYGTQAMNNTHPNSTSPWSTRMLFCYRADQLLITMGSYFRLLMIDRNKLVSDIKQMTPEELDGCELDESIQECDDFDCIINQFNEHGTCYFWEVLDSDVVHTVWGLGEIKAYSLHDLFNDNLSAEFTSILGRSEDGYPLEIIGEKVPKFIKEFEMLSTKLREMDGGDLHAHVAGDLAYLQEIFEQTAKELQEGYNKGFKDAIAVLCG
ncbi:hypothetical protein GF325_12555 [Candidatus Bathyarchaeota archaeon]|nr:hypothetical protein [Candidatus Bathyarchaeota archaeon]